LVTSALVISACSDVTVEPSGGTQAADSSPGVFDDRVVIGTHQPLTGPAAPGYSRISVGARAIYSYINDNGGVNGRRIDYKVQDDAYNPTKTVEVVKKLVLEEKVFAIVGGLGTPTHSKVIDYLNAEGVPDLLISSGALLWDDPKKYPMSTGFQPDYTREGKIQGKYIKDNFPGKKVGYLYQNDDVGRDAQRGLDKFLNTEVVTREGYDPANPDVTPQLQKLKAVGAEVVVCECIPAFMALAVLTSSKIGYKPQFITSTIGSDEATLTGLINEFAKRSGSTVQGNQLLTGMIGVGYLPRPTSTDDPWIKLFKEIHAKYIPEEPFTETLVLGMAQAYTFGQILKAAGRDLTRLKLVNALETTQLRGPGLTPFAFSKESHSGYTGTFLFKLGADGTATVIQQPMTTDREDGPVVPTETARVTPAASGLLR
jgi:ABC-type branched-subunit amino acid transport system substrate-binding protein